MNLAQTITPKSDQLNSDDLIAGPLTITITAVESGSAEQPVIIRYQGDNGHPYKPGKSMRRVLVMMWGSDGKDYVGRKLTLYRDPSIRFGSDEVGGIRISHASHITEQMRMALTVTRGRRKPYTVDPLAVEKVAANAVQSQASAPDASLDDAIWAAEGIGASKSAEGTQALQDWWKTLSKPVQVALKKKLDEDWKPNAHDADANLKEAAR